MKLGLPKGSLMTVLGGGIGFAVTQKVGDDVAWDGLGSTGAKWVGVFAPPVLLVFLAAKFKDKIGPDLAAGVMAGAGAALVNALLFRPPGGQTAGVRGLRGANVMFQPVQ